jgi:hypothetical protein
MKKLFYLFIFIFTVSCSSNSEELTDPKGNGDSVIDTDNSNGGTTCDKPNELRVEQTTSNSAICLWSEANGSQLYNIEYGIRGFSLGNGTRISVGSTTSTIHKEITNLNSATEYDFYVRANCGGSIYSEWQGPHSFVTN